MYNYYQPQAQPQYLNQRQNNLFLKGRPVSSIEEVKSMPIDFDGSIFYFPDLANHRIYSKQINLDGTASLNVYELREMPLEKPTVDFVTRQEFQEVIQQLRAALPRPQTPKEKLDF